MKRIKSVNGYTIMQAISARDEANYNCHIGEYNIYLSSDIRDFGLSNSYPEWESVDSLSVAEAMCGASKYAVAVDLAEEISGSTAQDMDLVLEVERLLEDGLSIEEVRARFIRDDEDLYEIDPQAYCLAHDQSDFPVEEETIDLSELAQTVHTDAEPSIYRSVRELTSAELDELKSGFYYGCDEYDALSDEDKAAVDAADYYWDIPDEIVFRAFDSISFVPEDFFCNLDSEEAKPAQDIHTEAQPESEISFPAGEGRTYPTMHKLLWAEAEDWCIDYFYAFPLAEYWVDTLDPHHELSFTCYDNNTVEVNDGPTGVIDETTTLSDIIRDFEAAFADWNANRSHASYIVCRDPDSGEYQTESQPLTEGLPSQGCADMALLREAAKMYAFSDCGGWEVAEIMIDGFKVEYDGWKPGMRFTFRYADNGMVVFDESFPEWDH